jgi:hypothetical protein
MEHICAILGLHLWPLWLHSTESLNQSSFDAEIPPPPIFPTTTTTTEAATAQKCKINEQASHFPITKASPMWEFV